MLNLFSGQPMIMPVTRRQRDAQTLPDLASYEECILLFSGGKDSAAAVLHLLELGVEPHRIELHHHLVDGREGSTLMDWPVTEAYCIAFAEAFGLRITFSWREGGFEREMLRTDKATAPVHFPDGNGGYLQAGGAGPSGTRRKFPQVSASLTTRWCSASLKVDAGSRYLTGHPRFADGRKRLVITGERAQESAARSRYSAFEPDRCDLRNGQRYQRWLDHWRPVLLWTEADVWAILERYRINAHPAYHLGFGRASCMSCIFGSASQWATVRALSPEHFECIARYEGDFGVTIHRSRSVREQADRGTPFPFEERWKRIALSTTYNEPIFVDPWVLPLGAYGDSAGPT